jgi:hypothetical protein
LNQQAIGIHLVNESLIILNSALLLYAAKVNEALFLIICLLIDIAAALTIFI